MVPGDKDDAGGCPDKDKYDPEHGAEGRLMVILYSNSQSLFCFLSSIVNKSSRYDILNTSPSIAACDTNQKLQGVGNHGHSCRGYQGQQGKQNSAGPVGVYTSLS